MAGSFWRLVLFTVGQQTYGVDIASVREVIVADNITPLPGAPPGVRGMINLRGKVAPVVDLQERLGLGQSGAEGRVEVVINESGGRTTGFAVGHVRDVRVVEEAAVQLEVQVPGQVSAWVRGIAMLGSELVTILDLDRLAAAAPGGAPAVGATA